MPTIKQHVKHQVVVLACECPVLGLGNMAQNMPNVIHGFVVLIF